MLRLEDIIEKVQSYNPSADLDLIKKAYVFSAKVHKGQVRLSGEPYLSHPLEVAGILADLRFDEASIATGLLHDTIEDTHTTFEKIKDSFGEEIASLVDGVTKISLISFQTKEEQQAENFRKMILAMARDIRVVLIKLADRLHNMRTLEPINPDKRIKISQETMDIYAPLADRLGISWLKNELEDISFRFINPKSFEELSKKMTEKRVEREKYIKDVKEILSKKLLEHDLKEEVSGRPKHFYSIYRKMEDQGIDFGKVYDILAFRITSHTLRECYEALGVIHSAWKPVPGRFKDYIAMPKANMYQSLHTTVIGHYGERIEIQIRTEEMHRIAEEGIAAHWRYKEGKAHKTEGEDERRFAWLKQLVELQRDLKDPREFLETVKGDLFPQEVYVFTPKGDVKEFPRGATAVDFAYSIHTEVGNRCTGARINGKWAPLRYCLKNGDTVEVETSTHHHPSRDWLKFVKTARARNKIRQWIKTEERERSILLGKEICEKDFKRNGLNFNKLIKDATFCEIVKEELNITDIDKFMAGIGYGKISVNQIIKRLIPPERLKSAHEKEKPAPKVPTKTGKADNAIIVRGLNDIMVHLAKCCNPLSGDNIIGFITKGRGIAIHTADCPNLLGCHPDRRVEVEWGKKARALRPVKIEVICADKKGLLANMSSTITSAEANISGAQIITTRGKKAVCVFEVQVKDLDHLQEVLKALDCVKGVSKVTRLKA
ncbi:MAG: RelA/SpoT family protein [Thermodesulfobacteriota bacterium]